MLRNAAVGIWLIVVALPAQAEEPTLHARVAPACVEILVGGQLAGSGWFAAPDGVVVTARHVVQSAFGGDREIEVVTADVVRKPARVVASDPAHDLALLKIAADNRTYPVLEVAERVPRAGEPVYLHGQMLFRHGLLLPGRVASDRAVFEYLPDRKVYARVVPVAPALVGGSSGGPWVDSAGRVVGNQVSTLSLGGSPVGLSFMAELDGIRRLLRERTSTTTATLGIAVEELWEKPPEQIAQFPPGTTAVLPVIVHEGGPAAAAGVNTQMVIVAVDDQPTRFRDELLSYVHNKKPGDRVKLTVIDAGKSEPREIEVALGRLKDEIAEAHRADDT